MKSLRRAVRQMVLPEPRKGWVAARAGLPAVGSRMVNRHGIEWVVRDHAPLPTVETIGRWNAAGPAPADDLYPVVSPVSLSRELTEFFHAIARCTTKDFAIVDTMPGRRKDGHVPGGNHLDTLCHPETNVLFLDAARVSEAVIAHEMGHAWLQYVERCEDLRTSPYDAEPGRARMVSYVQSYVLDLRVNALLRERGFDISEIQEDQAASLEQLAAALGAGYKPETAREEVFMALLVADAKFRMATEGAALVREDRALPAIRSARPGLDRLAGTLAEAALRNGHGSAEAVESAVDECLLAAFAFAGEAFDPAAELVRVDPPEPGRDKFPEWLPALSPGRKCDVGRHMALDGISSEWPHRIEQTLAGRARVVFTAPDGSRTSRVVVNESYGPPTPYLGMSEEVAEVKELMRQNEERRRRQFNPPAPPQPPTPFYPMSIQPIYEPVRLPRNYMAGTGRFLTAVRQEEWLAGEHPYGYALNNPVTYTDPSGNSPGGNLVNCINAWVRLGYSAQSACEHCKKAQGYRGGFRCENLPNSGHPVPGSGLIEPGMPGYDIVTGACSIIPHAGEGLVSDFDLNACKNTCRIAVMLIVSKVNSKALSKTCEAACNALAAKGCEGLFARCQRMGNSIQGKNCMIFYTFNCSGK